MVTEKGGNTGAQAQTAIGTVSGFLKNKMSPTKAARIDVYLKGEGHTGDIS